MGGLNPPEVPTSDKKSQEMTRDDAVNYEFEDEQDLRDRFWHPKRNEVVIDVGCGYGSYTLPALEVGATVYAIDANEDVLDVLAKKRAIATTSGTLIAMHLALYHGGQYPAELMRQIAVAGNDRDHNTIEWTTLDVVVERCELKRVDWVKIDVEGGEAGVLRGSLETLKRFHPKLLIEDHTGIYRWVARNNSSRRIKASLAQLGYKVEIVPYVGPGPDRNYLVCS